MAFSRVCGGLRASGANPPWVLLPFLRADHNAYVVVVDLNRTLRLLAYKSNLSRAKSLRQGDRTFRRISWVFDNQRYASKARINPAMNRGENLDSPTY